MFECERCGTERSYTKYDLERGRAKKYCQPCSVAVYNATRPPAKLGRKKAFSAKYYQKNKARLDTYSKEWRKRRRLEAIASLGGQCEQCYERDPIVLDFDHVDNDGNGDRGYNIVHKVLQSPWRFQLLCKNCNWRKEHNRRAQYQQKAG